MPITAQSANPSQTRTTDPRPIPQSIANSGAARPSIDNPPIRDQPQNPSPIQCQFVHNLPIKFQSITNPPIHNQSANPSPIRQYNANSDLPILYQSANPMLFHQTITNPSSDLQSHTNLEIRYQSNANPVPIHQSMTNPSIQCQSSTNRPIMIFDQSIRPMPTSDQSQTTKKRNVTNRQRIGTDHANRRSIGGHPVE